MDIIHTYKHMHKCGRARRSDTRSQHPCKPNWHQQPHPASFSGWAEWKSTAENIHIHICTIGKQGPSRSWAQTLPSLHSCWYRRLLSPVANTDRTIQGDLCAVTPGDTQALTSCTLPYRLTQAPRLLKGWSALIFTRSFHFLAPWTHRMSILWCGSSCCSETFMHTGAHRAEVVAWGGGWRECNKTDPLPDRA